MESKELYYITSIYMNAYLLSKGFEIEKTARLRNRKVALFYEKTDKLFEEINNYKSNEELSNFVTCYLKVKDIIGLHNQRDMLEEALSE